MSVKRVVSVLLSAALAIVGSAVVGSPAHAAVGYSHNVAFTWTDANNGISVLPVTFTAGDCRLEGTNQTGDPLWSSIQVVADAQPGQFDIVWNASAYTTSTTFADFWHGDWYFESDSAILFPAVHFDSIPMVHEFEVYRFRLRQTVTWDPNVARTITNVTWRGDC